MYPSTQYAFVKSPTVLSCSIMGEIMAWCCLKPIIRVGGCDRHNYYQKYTEFDRVNKGEPLALI